MRALITRFTAFYGSNPLHLLAIIASFALAGYVVLVMGAPALWNREVWWQSILVWFLAAVIGHDLVLFPLYALADRSLTAALAAMRGRRVASPPRVSPLNYLRVPAIGTGLSFLLFSPESSSRENSPTSRPPGKLSNPSWAAGCCWWPHCGVSARSPTPPAWPSPAAAVDRRPRPISMPTVTTPAP